MEIHVMQDATHMFEMQDIEQGDEWKQSETKAKTEHYKKEKSNRNIWAHCIRQPIEKMINEKVLFLAHFLLEMFIKQGNAKF